MPDGYGAPQRPWSDSDLAALVQPDRIHRNVYLDEAIFELEMERIYGRAWLFVGHESQVPNAGDYYCTTLGREPVVMTRHEDGTVRVLFNRCGHRGARVLNRMTGNARRFRCLYHGWQFNTDGSVASVPLREGFGEALDLKDRQRGMVPLPSVGSHRGFVFARMTAEGPDLMEHLGPARLVLDEVADRSPEGELEAAGGFHRYYYNGNWKHQAENLADQYHAPFSHESSTTPDGYQFSRRPGTSGTRLKMINPDGSAGTGAKGQWIFPNGHNACGAQTMDGEQGGEYFERYRDTLVERLGEERSSEVLTHQRHLGFFYPNFDLHVLAQAIRVILPIRVDFTEVRIFPLRLKGAPPEMFRDTVRLLNLTHSCSSLAQTDDVEAFERMQVGLRTRGEEWIRVQRGLDQDVFDEDKGGLRGPQFTETGIRNQHRAWLQYMTAGAR